MTYFTEKFSAEVVLPDGTVAVSARDIDRYLKANNLACQSDYSPAYMENIRLSKEKQQQTEIFAEIVQQYKKRLWNQ